MENISKKFFLAGLQLGQQLKGWGATDGTNHLGLFTRPEIKREEEALYTMGDLSQGQLVQIDYRTRGDKYTKISKFKRSFDKKRKRMVTTDNRIYEIYGNPGPTSNAKLVVRDAITNKVLNSETIYDYVFSGDGNALMICTFVHIEYHDHPIWGRTGTTHYTDYSIIFKDGRRRRVCLETLLPYNPHVKYSEDRKEAHIEYSGYINADGRIGCCYLADATLWVCQTRPYADVGSSWSYSGGSWVCCYELISDKSDLYGENFKFVSYFDEVPTPQNNYQYPCALIGGDIYVYDKSSFDTGGQLIAVQPSIRKLKITRNDEGIITDATVLPHLQASDSDIGNNLSSCNHIGENYIEAQVNSNYLVRRPEIQTIDIDGVPTSQIVWHAARGFYATEYFNLPANSFHNVVGLFGEEYLIENILAESAHRYDVMNYLDTENPITTPGWYDENAEYLFFNGIYLKKFCQQVAYPCFSFKYKLRSQVIESYLGYANEDRENGTNGQVKILFD